MTTEQLDRIEYYRQFLDKGFVNSNGIVDLYNEIFGASSTGRKQHYTSCGSCIRRLLKQLIQAAVEAKIDEADETVTEDENTSQSEENNQADNDTDGKEKSPEIKPQTPNKPSKKKKPVKKKR